MSLNRWRWGTTPKMVGRIPPAFPEAHIAIRSDNEVEIDDEVWLLPFRPIPLSHYWTRAPYPDERPFEGRLTPIERATVIELNRQRGTFSKLYNL